MNNSEPIYITKPTLNSLSEYTALLEKIWETRQLTNTGPLSRQLESALSEFLSTPHVLLVTNGTLAIHVAIQALDLKDWNYHYTIHLDFDRYQYPLGTMHPRFCRY